MSFGIVEMYFEMKYNLTAYKTKIPELCLQILLLLLTSCLYANRNIQCRFSLNLNHLIVCFQSCLCSEVSLRKN